MRTRLGYTDKSARETLDEIQWQLKKEKRARELALRKMAIEGRINELPVKTLKKIKRELQQPQHHKKRIADRFGLPHNVIMYIWRHYL